MTYEDFINQIKSAFNGNVENNVDNVENSQTQSDSLSDASTGNGADSSAPDAPGIGKDEIESVVRSELLKILGDLKQPQTTQPIQPDPGLSGVIPPQVPDERSSEDIISERLLSGMGIKTKK